MLAVEAGSGGIHDHDALDHIAQFAHVAGPRIAHQHLDGIIGDLARTAAIGGRKFLQEMAREKRNVFFALAQRRNKEGNHVQR